MRVIIDVKQQDIDSGIRGNCKGCPIALALHKVVADYTYFVVGTADILLSTTGRDLPRTQIVFLPEAAKAFIAEFDGHRPSGELPQPITFAITIDDVFCRAPTTPTDTPLSC